MPTSLSRSEGDIHADGNPHIHTDPVNAIIIARNILTGLRRVSPDNAATFTAREQDFERRVLEATIGAELVNVLTAPVAYDLLKSDKLYDFLGTKQYQGKPLLDRLGGWMKEAQVFRGKEIACYHKEWAYFSNRYQVTCAEYIEAKPGIPPTPGHVQEVIALMKQRKIRVLFASNYFDRNQIQQVAQRTGAKAVIVPENTDGAPGVNTYFDLMNAGSTASPPPSREAPYLMDLSLFLPPLVACLVIVAIHSYLGPPRHRAGGHLRRPVAGPDGGARLGRGHPRGEPARLDGRRSSTRWASPRSARCCSRSRARRKRAGCRRRPSSASSTSSPRRRRSWSPTAPRAAARRSRTSWWAASCG